MFKLYARRRDLLGGGLKNLAHAWRFAEKTGVPMALIWERDSDFRGPLPFTDIFAAPYPFELIEEDIALPDDAVIIRQQKDAPDLATLAGRTVVFSNTGFLRLPGDEEAVVDQEARALIRTLEPRREIAAALARVNDRIDLKRFVAVHIRRGSDIVRFIKEDKQPWGSDYFIGAYVQRYADLDSYRAALDTLAPGAPVLIFSNDLSEAAQLKGRLPDREAVTIGELADSFENLPPPPPSQWGSWPARDYLEMRIMAETAQIIGSRSNFMSFPQMLGGMPYFDVVRYCDPRTMMQMVEQEFEAAIAAKVFARYADFMRVIKRPDAAEAFSARAKTLNA